MPTLSSHSASRLILRFAIQPRNSTVQWKLVYHLRPLMLTLAVNSALYPLYHEGSARRTRSLPATPGLAAVSRACRPLACCPAALRTPAFSAPPRYLSPLTFSLSAFPVDFQSTSFQQLTNPFFRNPFVFSSIQNPRGGTHRAFPEPVRFRIFEVLLSFQELAHSLSPKTVRPLLFSTL